LFYHKQGVKLGDRKLLNKNQEATVPKMSIDVMPDQLKLDYALWTTEAVRDLIAREFGITIGRGTVGDYLNAWGSHLKSQKRRLMNNVPKKFKNSYRKNIQ
jgi:transposase